MEGGAEEADLYESLPGKATVGTYMLAGAMAGMGEHCVMYPFDCVKVRQDPQIFEMANKAYILHRLRLFARHLCS